MNASNPVERFKQLCKQVEQDNAEALRREELRELSAHSALIIRAQREWPKQANAVRRFADSHGLSLGEAWLLTIERGVQSLNGDRK